MLVQEMVINRTNGSEQHETRMLGGQYSHIPKLSRSDVSFPLALSAPRKRTPNVAVAGLADLIDQEQHGQSMGRLTITARESPIQETEALNWTEPEDTAELPGPDTKTQNSFDDLPLEVQGKVLDYIFGDMHSVNAASASLRGKSVSSLMRHPRRKAVSDLALVSATWREMVQERIYRHIKIKGTRAGLSESEDYFCSHMHLTKHVRHIEFWVPVWGDKASFVDSQTVDNIRNPIGRNGYHNLANQVNESLMTANDLLGFNFKLSVYSATLSEIFTHISVFFPFARVFTLEGGHCKKSNMIRHFPNLLFPSHLQALEKLPQIRTFAMRGAWNIMRQYSDWQNLEAALPNVEEWHCGYAKPRVEADATINQILLRLPCRIRHLNISLDGMYSKDPTTLGSSALSGPTQPHLCEHLGAVLPQLESLSFTGKICECLFTSAITALSKPASQPDVPSTTRRIEPRLKVLEIVVKSCCRQRVTSIDVDTGLPVIDELGGVMADGAGITNLIFIRAFERLVLHTVDALAHFPMLEYVRIRFIDLDSPCTLLNPYWLMEHGKVFGVWNEEIVERLSETRPSCGYEELGEGIEYGVAGKSEAIDADGNDHTSVSGGTVGNAYPHGHLQGHMGGSAGNASSSGSAGGVSGLYPRVKPRSIKTSSYRIVAETRGS